MADYNATDTGSDITLTPINGRVADGVRLNDVLDIEQIVEASSLASSNVAAASAIKDLVTYSSEEVCVGEYNGEKVYKKNYIGTITLTTADFTTQVIGPAPSGLKRILSGSGALNNPNGWFVPMPHIWQSAGSPGVILQQAGWAIWDGTLNILTYGIGFPVTYQYSIELIYLKEETV